MLQHPNTQELAFTSSGILWKLSWSVP